MTAEEILAKVGDADAVGRPHLADVLIDKGVVATRDEAFADYLSPGKPGYVGRYSIPTGEAIELVKAAGGKAVLAHPWSRGSDSVMTADRIAELVESGLDGIEVYHHDHGPEQREGLLAIARQHDLVVTGSSDYHGAGKPRPGSSWEPSTPNRRSSTSCSAEVSAAPLVLGEEGDPRVGEALRVLDRRGVRRVLDDVDLGAEPLRHRGLDVVRPGVVVGAPAHPDR